MTHRPAEHGQQTLPTLLTERASEGPFRDVHGVTHAGHRREHNEDHFMILDLERRVSARMSSLGSFERRQGATATLLVVADGMGGHDNGELASAVTLDTIAHYAMCNIPLGDGVIPELVRKGFQSAALECQRRMREAAARKEQRLDLGTTLTALYAHAGAVALAHVGDSRAYGLRDGQMHQLTRDHTLAAMMQQAAGAELAPGYAHALTNAIGGSENEPEVEGPHFALQSGDRFLLCSDGLTDELDDAAIADELRHGTAREVCDRILGRALATEARDNVTLVVAIA